MEKDSIYFIKQMHDKQTNKDKSEDKVQISGSNEVTIHLNNNIATEQSHNIENQNSKIT